jgi:hypothetical protein
LACCTGILEQEIPGIYVFTASRLYSLSDTLCFTVVNFSTIEENFFACCKLTYWLENYVNNAWHEQSAIRAGDCLAICGDLTLSPNQTYSERLPLSDLATVIPGKYRIKVRYYLPGTDETNDVYSNTFILNI